MPKLNRNVAIAGGVVLFHLAALWVLQTGLLRRAVDVVVPVRMLSEIVAPQPQSEPSAMAPRPAPPMGKPLAREREREKSPPPRRAPVSRQPSPSVPAENLEAQPESALEAQPRTALEAQPITPHAAGPKAEPRPARSGEAAAPGPAAAAKIELPASDASYLQNPPLVYPPISKRLGEEGKVTVRVLIGADGIPQKAELKRSSGFERLDQSALDYVMKCRYVPGKVGGTPQAMWYEAPVSFILR